MNRILDQRDGDDRRTEEPNGRFKLTLEKVLTWVIAALLAYGAVNARIAVLESKQEGVEQRLYRMENKIDELLRRP